MHMPAELGESPGWSGRSKKVRCGCVGGAFSFFEGLRTTGIDTRTDDGELRVLRKRRRRNVKQESGSRSNGLVMGDVRPFAGLAGTYAQAAGESGLDLRPDIQTIHRPAGRSGGAGSLGGEAR
jgi:hypothetical protein